jgi:hypothetical protein
MQHYIDNAFEKILNGGKQLGDISLRAVVFFLQDNYSGQELICEIEECKIENLTREEIVLF